MHYWWACDMLWHVDSGNFPHFMPGRGWKWWWKCRWKWQWSRWRWPWRLATNVANVSRVTRSNQRQRNSNWCRAFAAVSELLFGDIEIKYYQIYLYNRCGQDDIKYSISWDTQRNSSLGLTLPGHFPGKLSQLQDVTDVSKAQLESSTEIPSFANPTLLGVTRTPTSPAPRQRRFHRPHLQVTTCDSLEHSDVERVKTFPMHIPEMKEKLRINSAELEHKTHLSTPRDCESQRSSSYDSLKKTKLPGLKTLEAEAMQGLRSPRSHLRRSEDTKDVKELTFPVCSSARSDTASRPNQRTISRPKLSSRRFSTWEWEISRVLCFSCTILVFRNDGIMSDIDLSLVQQLDIGVWHWMILRACVELHQSDFACWNQDGASQIDRVNEGQKLKFEVKSAVSGGLQMWSTFHGTTSLKQWMPTGRCLKKLTRISGT